MAKEFKEYDRKYASYRGRFFDYEQDSLLGIEKQAHMLRGYMYASQIEYWDADTIRHAVYFGKGAEEWQKFRVSLKSQSTWMKVHRLHLRYRWMMSLDDQELKRLEKCRIDNYIGALQRGGQLNAAHGIVR